MPKNRVTCLFLALSVALPTIAQQPQLPPDRNEAPAARSFTDYRIGRHDLLEIEVFGVEELSQAVRVGDDGSITLPLLGKINVFGMTRFEAERLIMGLLEGRFVRDPQVSLFVREYESRKVSVSGAVREPGTFEMLGRKTLLEMISLAGGLDTDLGDEIVVFRRGADGERHRIAVDLDELVHEAVARLNLQVVPGDIIYVPSIEKTRIFVTGAVQKPNAYEIPRNQPVTLLKAITLAGGITDRAAQKKVRIIRVGPNGERITIRVNLKQIKKGTIDDPALNDDDMILVPQSSF